MRKGPLETQLEGRAGVLLGWHPKSRCLTQASLAGPADSSGWGVRACQHSQGAYYDR